MCVIRDICVYHSNEYRYTALLVVSLWIQKNQEGVESLLLSTLGSEKHFIQRIENKKKNLYFFVCVSKINPTIMVSIFKTNIKKVKLKNKTFDINKE